MTPLPNTFFSSGEHKPGCCMDAIVVPGAISLCKAPAWASILIGTTKFFCIFSGFLCIGKSEKETI